MLPAWNTFSMCFEYTIAGALLAIRAGAWSYEQLIEHAARLRAGIADKAERSRLPEEPDHEALDTLCQSIVEEVLA